MNKFKNYSHLSKLFDEDNKNYKWIPKVFQVNMLVFSILVYYLYSLNGKNTDELSNLDRFIIGAFMVSFTVFLFTFILMAARQKTIDSGSHTLLGGFVVLLKKVFMFIFLPSLVITCFSLLYMYLNNN